MLVCKIYVVIIHNRSCLFFLLNKYCTEGEGTENFHFKISNALRVGAVLIFFGLIEGSILFLSFFAVTNNIAAPSFIFHPSSTVLSYRRPATANVSRLKTIKYALLSTLILFLSY